MYILVLALHYTYCGHALLATVLQYTITVLGTTDEALSGPRRSHVERSSPPQHPPSLAHSPPLPLPPKLSVSVSCRVLCFLAGGALPAISPATPSHRMARGRGVNYSITRNRAGQGHASISDRMYYMHVRICMTFQPYSSRVCLCVDAFLIIINFTVYISKGQDLCPNEDKRTKRDD